MYLDVITRKKFHLLQIISAVFITLICPLVIHAAQDQRRTTDDENG
jgi:hypothetical protein